MTQGRISPAEPVSELRRVKIRENGEPLVNFLEFCPDLRMDRRRFNYQPETVLRQEAAVRLCRANEWLMKKRFRLQVVEGWRSPHNQRRMYLAVWKQFQKKFPEKSDVSLRRLVNQFSAPMSDRVPPPHTTGGAMDLTLTTLNGHPLDVQSPFGAYDHACFPLDAPGLSDAARKNRDLLREAMEVGGITNYPMEYWHWSYGDQG